MNEHIHELISSYLHGGNTPEQDRELFDACSRNPETADLLRQQILLSLKLRGLREQTEVPADLRNALLLRINELQGERKRSAAPATANVPRERERRFGWVHILGSSIATAAVAGLFFVLLPDAQSPDTASLSVTDTVRVVERDTVLQTRDILRPVYITRTVVREKKDGIASPVDERLPITQTPAPVDDKRQPLPQVIEDVTYAVVQPVREAQRQAKVSQYLEQYNAMLASVESVQLSSRDRVSQ